MQHTIKTATVTATTDRGEFTAIAAAYTLDRDGDEIIYGAFAKSIDKWRASGKRIPLHWNHSGKASDIIGSVDPASLTEVEGVGLQASGRLDLEDSDTAREAWRSMKNGAMSLSFGYLAVKTRKRKDGVQELHELDLFEISIVPVPANPDTRILSMKSADDAAKVVEALTTQLQEVQARLDTVEKAMEDLRTKADVTAKGAKPRAVDPLAQKARTAMLDVLAAGSTPPPPVTTQEQPPGPDIEPEELKRRSRDLIVQLLSE